MLRTNTTVRFQPDELEAVKAHTKRIATKTGRNVSLSDVVRELTMRGLKEAERAR